MTSPTLFDQLWFHTLVGVYADFARARQRQPALASCPSPEAAVRALRQSRLPGDTAKAAVAAALLAETRAGSRSLQEVLLQGLLPKLVRIRYEGEAFIEDRSVLEPLVAAAFVEAVAAYSAANAAHHPVGFLLRKTRQGFLRSVRKLHAAEEPLTPVGLRVHSKNEAAGQDDLPLDTGAPIEAANDPGGYIDEASMLLKRTIGDRLSPMQLAVVEATVVHDETLKEYAARRHPFLCGQERQRAYEQLRRERTRGVELLRGALPALGIAPNSRVS